MTGDCLGNKPHPQARVVHSLAQVGFLPVQPEAFVESAELPHDVASHQETCADYEVDVADGRV